MEQNVFKQEPILLEVVTPINKRIRTHKNYWGKITNEKHIELKYGLDDLKATLISPDQIRESIKDDTIHIYYKNLVKHTLICVTKVLNGDGLLLHFIKLQNQNRKVKYYGKTKFHIRPNCKYTKYLVG